MESDKERNGKNSFLVRKGSDVLREGYAYNFRKIRTTQEDGFAVELRGARLEFMQLMQKNYGR